MTAAAPARPVLVPEEATVRVTATGPLWHQCPHVEELDAGTVTISWTCAGQTLELHALAAYLRSYEAERISSEDITRVIREELAGLTGIADVEVTTSWHTAGMAVEVTTGR